MTESFSSLSLRKINIGTFRHFLIEVFARNVLNRRADRIRQQFFLVIGNRRDCPAQGERCRRFTRSGCRNTKRWQTFRSRKSVIKTFLSNSVCLSLNFTRSSIIRTSWRSKRANLFCPSASRRGRAVRVNLPIAFGTRKNGHQNRRFQTCGNRRVLRDPLLTSVS